MTASTSLPTFETASATLGRESETERVHTALSATASVRAEPVTTIPLSVRAEIPPPTCINPPNKATASINVAAKKAIALRRSIWIIGLSGIVMA